MTNTEATINNIIAVDDTITQLESLLDTLLDYNCRPERELIQRLLNNLDILRVDMINGRVCKMEG